jgi:hypothetical protein
MSPHHKNNALRGLTQNLENDLGNEKRICNLERWSVRDLYRTGSYKTVAREGVKFNLIKWQSEG